MRSPGVFQVSKQPLLEIVSNCTMFDWHVFITSIFRRINGLLIVWSLLSVVCYVNINMSNIKQTTLMFTFGGKLKNLSFELSNFDVPFPVECST